MCPLLPFPVAAVMQWGMLKSVGQQMFTIMGYACPANIIGIGEMDKEWVGITD